jgi:hypothetical protein
MDMSEYPDSRIPFSIARRLKGGQQPSPHLSWSASGIDIRLLPKSLGISIRDCHERESRLRFARLFSKAEGLQESARNAINHPRRDPRTKLNDFSSHHSTTKTITPAFADLPI